MLSQDVVVALKMENTIFRWLSSEKLVAPKRDNIQLAKIEHIYRYTVFRKGEDLVKFLQVH